MKPTKEQLADPKWWDNNTLRGHNFCYWDYNNNSCVFRHHDDFLGELLAKRPEAKWVPEVGEWFIASGGANMAFIGVDSRNAYVCEIKGGGLTRLYDFLGCKPLKTQREELIDILVNTHNLSEGMQADAILATFELTEKDGE